MADDLIERLDEFAARLLEDAENGTSGPEDSPGPSLQDRVAVFKAVTAYLDKRGSRPAGGAEKPKSDDDDGSDEKEPTIVRLQRQVNRRRR